VNRFHVSRTQLLVWLFVTGLWALLTSALIIISIYKVDALQLHDYAAYYEAAQRINNGQSLYIDVQASKTYLYPPLLAQSLTPLEAMLPFMETAVLWVILNLFCLLVATYLMASQLQKGWKQYVIWLLPLLFLPTLETFMSGQIVPIMLLLIVGAMVAYKQEHPWIAGGLLAIVTWLKIYPILIIGYFILRRDWRVVASAFVGGMLLLVLQLGISGIDVVMSFFTDTLMNLASQGQDFILFRNNSIFGFTHRLLENSTLAKLTQWSIVGILIAIMGWIVRYDWRVKLKDLTTAKFELEYAVLVVFMLLIGSTLLSTSMMPILLPVAIALKYSHTIKHYIVFAGSFVLLSMTFEYVSREYVINAHPIIQGFGFYALVGLWGLLTYLHWEESNQS
jgi:hypothetical protein